MEIQKKKKISSSSLHSITMYSLNYHLDSYFVLNIELWKAFSDRNQATKTQIEKVKENDELEVRRKKKKSQRFPNT